ncbi:MAG: 1-deoxy-D-xylulose-5-phosphate synthase [Muribaculaceae bacterium]|nr:1-deoxy-D-xylulose-5-phosphate synthase [Bacteroides sp.]MBD5414819.1 1-deoxy-D-xylulose-5-phosphate synthase [Bacteroides sp.]MDE6229938.1 1-deoxy-D-xylulose-5-phosphate synthase [Muribaculaceae bacterium]
MKDFSLEDIKTPADIREMDVEQLTRLAAMMRSSLLKKLSAHGGHIGPNLGMVEAVIALHYVFNTPTDKIVFDVSHQTYPHKMLTGRMDAFTDPAHYDDVTGYTNPAESDYDLYSLGHTSSAVALAAGLAMARDLKGDKENVVAVIGDGSLSGGVAFEGLDTGATLGSNFIVVVNDNQMSIAENHGGIYSNLELLRSTNGQGEPNLFRSFGYDYHYVRYGNDLHSLIEAFRAVKDSTRPVVVHINTMKGMGLPAAEANKEEFHYSGPFDLKTGAPLHEELPQTAPKTYDDLFADTMLRQMKANPGVVAITAGTPGVLGFTPARRKEAGRQFVDVGIAEQAAVDLASGLAKGGMRPVAGFVSSFLQRAYDQFSQDIALNRQPATFVVFYGSMFGMNDETHLGFFDIALLANIPDLLVLAPTCREEFESMLDWAIGQKELPVVIRTPGAVAVSNPQIEPATDYSRPAYQIVRQGSEVALIGAGLMFGIMAQAADLLEKQGVKATLINPRELSALDTATLDSLKGYKAVITAEDGIIDGGFGQKVASYLGQAPAKVVNLGLPKEFLNRYDYSELQTRCGLTPQQIADRAISELK